jgi:hypothetical protein
MNKLQAQIIENTDDLPKKFLEEIVDFTAFVKQKVQNQAFKKRMKQSERDIKAGRVKSVTSQELFRELGI